MPKSITNNLRDDLLTISDAKSNLPATRMQLLAGLAVLIAFIRFAGSLPARDSARSRCGFFIGASAMGASPPIKVYRLAEYVASCHYFEDAAALAGLTQGSVVKWRGKHVIWREGSESVAAGDSYDQAAEIMRRRVDEIEF